MTTALIAEDEPVLAAEIREELGRLWPDLVICATVHDGHEALREIERHQPHVLFLDVKMPGLTGIEVARVMGTRAHVVFITAFDQYAVQAFEHGALDYLVKPVERARLAETVSRLEDRMRAAAPASNTEALLQQLATQLQRGQGPATLRWVRASVGQTLRLIPTEDIDFLRSEEKYTLIAWRDDAGQPREAVIRTPLKDLMTQLDAAQFAQVHRSVVVNMRSIAHVTRGLNETASIHLKGRAEVLPVSRSYLHLFRQM